MRADEGKSYDSSEEDESIKPVALRCHSQGVLAFFRRGNGATVFDLARRDGTKLHKRVLGYDHRRIKLDMRRI
jgi:hypothetical protein